MKQLPVAFSLLTTILFISVLTQAKILDSNLTKQNPSITFEEQEKIVFSNEVSTQTDIIRNQHFGKIKISNNLDELPSKFTWEDKNILKFNTNMQKDCPTTWVSAPISAFEALYSKQNKENIDFSEQFILSCSSYNKCDSLTFGTTLGVLQTHKGIPIESSLPYGSTILPENCKQVGKISLQKFKIRLSNKRSLEQLKHLIVSSPGIVLQAQFNLDQYKEYNNSKGVLQCVSNKPYQFAHLVGYDSTQNYFIAKGAHGNTWGYDGYFHLSTNCLGSSWSVYEIYTFQGINTKSEFTWQNKNILKFNTNMGTCPATWISAPISAFEAVYARQNKNYVDLSQGFILSCASNKQCDFNSMDSFLNVVNQYKGIPLETTLPYTENPNQSEDCKTISIFDINYDLTQYYYFDKQRLDQIKYSIMSSPGVVVQTKYDIAQYKQYNTTKGVLRCDSNARFQYSHVVGYNSEGKYFIAKGGYGNTWGYDGYFHLSTDCVGFDFYYNIFQSLTPSVPEKESQEKPQEKQEQSDQSYDGTLKATVSLYLLLMLGLIVVSLN